MSNDHTSMDFGERVSAALAALADARRRKSDVEHQAQLAYDAEAAPHRQLLRELVERFEETAFLLSKDEAPVARSGMPLPPTELTATADGIELFWDADWPDYPVTHTVTWAELMKEEAGHAHA
jgi:hypothetical protein